MAVSKVYNGTSWVTGVVKTWNGTAWEDQPKFYDGTAWVDLYSSAVVTLSAPGTILAADLDFPGPWNTVAGIRVNTDGTWDKFTSTITTSSYTQIAPTTDWIIPNSAASSLYQFKLDVTSNAPNFNSDTTGVWHSMTGPREWYYQSTTLGSATCSWTLRVRYNGGAEIDSQALTVQVINGL